MRLLLITSRETKRWVLPKGNPIRGLDPHLAAAAEAYEEAGISGFVCPTPVGNYAYDKRRRNGSVIRATVDVYPLAFITQLDTWPMNARRNGSRWPMPPPRSRKLNSNRSSPAFASPNPSPAARCVLSKRCAAT